MAIELAVGVTLRLRLAPSMSCHVAPSLLGSRYCSRLGAVIRAGGGVVAAGVTEEDAAAAPVPTAFVAATVNQYVVPLVRPVTAAAVSGAVTVWGVCAVEPMYGVTV